MKAAIAIVAPVLFLCACDETDWSAYIEEKCAIMRDGLHYDVTAREAARIQIVAAGNNLYPLSDLAYQCLVEALQISRPDPGQSTGQ